MGPGNSVVRLRPTWAVPGGGPSRTPVGLAGRGAPRRSGRRRPGRAGGARMWGRRLARVGVSLARRSVRRRAASVRPSRGTRQFPMARPAIWWHPRTACGRSRVGGHPRAVEPERHPGRQMHGGHRGPGERGGVEDDQVAGVAGGVVDDAEHPPLVLRPDRRPPARTPARRPSGVARGRTGRTRRGPGRT